MRSARAGENVQVRVPGQEMGEFAVFWCPELAARFKAPDAAAGTAVGSSRA